MKPILKIAVLVLLTGALLYVSCKKEYSCENCRETNKSPIANAGRDTIIILPTDSVSLDGSTSSDADGTITGFQWTKISGPVSFSVINASAARTVVENLAAGYYHFELKVTDNGGLSANDTVQIIVNDPVHPNHPPVANAGPDTSITLPVNSITLNGSGSTDPENNITSYTWTKISGPSSFNIKNVNALQALVTNLVQGVYQFELNVTDGGGLISKDTVEVIVNAAQTDPCSSNRPIINAQLIPFGALSQARQDIAVASAGNKILFAGGRISFYNAGGDATSRVDIYDVVSQSWSTAELSVPRFFIAAIAAGNKIFFAGGDNVFSIYSGKHYPTVDIYDAVSNTWSVASLSDSGCTAIATVGNKVLFTGEFGSNNSLSAKVDIYDLSTNIWSTISLSEARYNMSAVTINNKVYFAGGVNKTSDTTNDDYSSTIDIYDNATGSWSTSSLSVPKCGMGSIAVGNKIYWAGGFGYGDDIYKSVEIKDVNTQNTLFDCLSKPKAVFDAVEKDDKIVFFTNHIFWGAGQNNWFDLYDITSNTWSIGMMNQELFRASIISVNNKIYVAGATYPSISGPYQYSNQVWKLEF